MASTEMRIESVMSACNSPRWGASRQDTQSGRHGKAAARSPAVTRVFQYFEAREWRRIVIRIRGQSQRFDRLTLGTGIGIDGQCQALYDQIGHVRLRAVEVIRRIVSLEVDEDSGAGCRLAGPREKDAVDRLDDPLLHRFQRDHARLDDLCLEL